jgi:hypothetical protein
MLQSALGRRRSKWTWRVALLTLMLGVAFAVAGVTLARGAGRTPRSVVTPASGGQAGVLPRVPVYEDAPLHGKGLQVRPYQIVNTGDGSGVLSGASLRHGKLRWSVWNGSEGLGRGDDWLDDCNPDCARGTFHAYPANIKVFRPRTLGGYYVFTRMTITYTRSTPYPGHRSWTSADQLFGGATLGWTPSNPG